MRVPGFACSTGRYASPTALFAVGVTVPLRTTSTRWPSRYTSCPGRATTRGSSTRNPASRRLTPASFCCFRAARPTKSAPLSSFTIQPSPASYGVTVSSMSLPYSGYAASSRNVSRAPSPHGSARPGPAIAYHSFSRSPARQYSSKPSSPVYPVREMKHSRPATFPCVKW